MENECELKMFKVCAVYPRVGPFGYTPSSVFLRLFFPLCVCVLKILSILKKKKKICTQTLSLNFDPFNNILGHYNVSYNSFKIRKFVERNCKTLYICVYN